MKKLLAMLLCLVMVLSLFAGCAGGDTTESSSTPESEPESTETVPEKEAVVPEEVPEALYHWSFDDATGIAAVVQGDKAADSINDGATYDIIPSDHEILFANGPVGQCLYLDGKYGVQLTDLASIDTDAYTISFWMNADRLSTYGPVVQMGRNIGDAADAATDPDTYRTCTWVNFTKTEWGTSSADIFPVVWNRNSDTTVWPWVYAGDDAVHGKREWVLVTLVSSGEKYTYAEDGLERVGCKLYLNGEMVFDASADLGLYGGLAPEILTGDGVEGYIGINYWDTIFKGFIDELYVFNTALTDGQVLSLFQEGDINVQSVAPEASTSVEEETEPEPLAAAPVDENAIDVLGTPDRTLGWWTENSQSWELADGASVTVKMNNYSSGVSNWHNFVVGLINTPITAETLPSADNYAGYAEYAVVRADAFGWGDASYAGNFTTSWGNDWAGWLALMTDAEVTMVISRNGGEVTIDFTFTGADGTVMTEQAVITSTLTADAPCHFFIGGESAYIEILSVA